MLVVGTARVLVGGVAKMLLIEAGPTGRSRRSATWSGAARDAGGHSELSSRKLAYRPAQKVGYLIRQRLAVLRPGTARAGVRGTAAHEGGAHEDEQVLTPNIQGERREAAAAEV